MASLTPEERQDLKARRSELMKLLTNGAKNVSHADKSVSYRSIDEIKQAIAEIDLQLNGRRTRIIKTYTVRA